MPSETVEGRGYMVQGRDSRASAAPARASSAVRDPSPEAVSASSEALRAPRSAAQRSCIPIRRARRRPLPVGLPPPSSIVPGPRPLQPGTCRQPSTGLLAAPAVELNSEFAAYRDHYLSLAVDFSMLIVDLAMVAVDSSERTPSTLDATATASQRRVQAHEDGEACVWRQADDGTLVKPASDGAFAQTAAPTTLGCPRPAAPALAEPAQRRASKQMADLQLRLQAARAMECERKTATKRPAKRWQAAALGVR